jgi:hypothetical protein
MLTSNNADRAKRAEEALIDYAGVTDDHDEAVIDLLTDIMHWGDCHNVDWESIERQARMHYEAEIAEELKEYTVFCMNCNRQGTMWIDCVNVPEYYSTSQIAETARQACAEAWDWPVDKIICVGIAEGNIHMENWDDDSPKGIV